MVPEKEEYKKELIDVIMLMGIPARLPGYPEDSLPFLQQGERLAKELEDTKSLALFHASMGSTYSYAANHAVALRYTEEAFEEARETQDLALMVPHANQNAIWEIGEQFELKELVSLLV
jgi:hypothetical protein